MVLKIINSLIPRSQLAKGAIGTFGLKIAFLVLSFLSSIFIARLLGAEGYGTYTYVFSWVMLLQIPASLGLQSLLEREVAVYCARGEWGSINGLLRWASKYVLIISIGIACIAAGIASMFPVGSSPETNQAFILALLLLPLVAMTALRRGAMKGLNAIIKGQMPETILQPSFMICGALVLSVLHQNQISPTWMVVTRCLVGGSVFLAGTWLLFKTLPNDVKISTPEYNRKAWLNSIVPFLLISCTHVINTRSDAIMLGMMSGEEDVGIYTVASRGAGLITFILVAVNTSLRPKIASAFAKGDNTDLQAMATKSVRVIFFGSLPIALGLILFGKSFLLLFGDDFVVGRSILTILCIGKLFDAATGSVGPILNMTGHERITALGVGASGVINIVLNLILIPRYGGEGAALATASSLMLWNIFLVIGVRQKLGVKPTIMGL